MKNIIYRKGNDLDLDAVIELYKASTLGERRPIDSREIMSDMIRHANLVITAWAGDLLVGIARSLTDFTYVAYLADLRKSHQRMGIGKELIRLTRLEMGPRSMVVLLSAPAAVDYYPHLGHEHFLIEAHTTGLVWSLFVNAKIFNQFGYAQNNEYQRPVTPNHPKKVKVCEIVD